MNDRQKILFRQLQLVILGLVIFIGGILADHQAFRIIGIIVLILGIIRYYSFWKLLKKLEQDEDTEA
ncbi:hypothetical protein H5979_07480 [Faecalicoccus pleomorphus]|uniref:hypothetical protein n=1 Tax=Faecalicoccus pleomorphus TaxID=1323 RepID=UPI001962028D|nr:hypothetical protein [Faecalicoccus pleomorphus]MBM6678519.1 hypothetical protein [Faecalicoccus pleomorphus]